MEFVSQATKQLIQQARRRYFFAQATKAAGSTGDEAADCVTIGP
jgi:hypothetical protein